SRNDHNWKSGEDLTRKLIDIAHKGGNFLLNVGPTELGEFTPETRQILATMGRWMQKHGQAIYGTTQSPFKKLAFNGRCTRKGNTLYLHVFEWPDSGLFLYGLKTAVRSARVLGGETLTMTRQAIPGQPVTLLIDRPTRLDPIATVVELRLEGPPVVEETTVALHPLPDGSFQLTASQAEIQGQTARLETKGGRENIGFWTHSEDTVHWRIRVPAARSYQVRVEYACAPENAGSTYRIRADESEEAVTAIVQPTGGWEAFRTVTLEGQLRLPAGYHTLRVAPQSMPRGAVMNLRRVILTPVP
ncbi:MAG: alpha-L-fucosidase, partial [Chthonomonadaceae bacterium]|nr:alpha-L-fucosidase [Chthonomonadaceae bacterium]